ncbi:hypothetical protein JHK85_010438 [Glycine max]|uniref:Uncharacterized protein n=1 Tax=Glycine soja TaxID=3848 RepID=A0A0B2R8F0_GLYSO|nr:hypothetical protein JHK85_010438 [Glycine max]KAG5066437.1 hypothetical protein JHK86_010168 [Glycine max]KHN29810.1 hypothetical protein glysoja_041121 [Glycine soja]
MKSVAWGCWQRRTQRKIGVLFGERKPRNTTTTPWKRERSREEPSLCCRGVAREKAHRGASISFVVVVLSEKKPAKAAQHRVKKTMKT